MEKILISLTIKFTRNTFGVYGLNTGKRERFGGVRIVCDTSCKYALRYAENTGNAAIKTLSLCSRD